MRESLFLSYLIIALRTDFRMSALPALRAVAVTIDAGSQAEVSQRKSYV